MTETGSTMLGRLFEKKEPDKEYIFKEGEVECAKCGGSGIDRDTLFPHMYKCRRCDGTGKTDWVTNVMGKSDEDYEVSSSSSLVSSSSSSTSSIRRKI
jgi:DnaJ-class molecular chaperone